VKDTKFKFTDTRLRKLSYDEARGKRQLYWDSDEKGLAICLTKTGIKSFQFQMWSRKHKRSLVQTLGAYPALSLREARMQTAHKRMQVNEGKDIVATAKQFRDEDIFSELFDKWLTGPGKMKRAKAGMSERSKKNVDDDLRRYKLYLEGPFGKKKVSWFNAERIRKWHLNITTIPKQRGSGTIKPATANQAFSLVRRVFNAMMPERINPCTGVVKFSEKSRDRFLQPDELKLFFTALSHPDTSELLRDYVLLSLFTGARRSNVLSMHWNEISFDRLIWTIPANKSKNDEAMDIPIVDDALAILKKRKKSSNSMLVFPGKGKTGHYQEPKRAWTTMLKRAGLTDVRLHDLRRTMGSYQTMTGASTAIVGKTLGHKSPASTAVYARLNLDPVRDSMEKAIGLMFASRELPDKVVSMNSSDK
jgi:integrase